MSHRYLLDFNLSTNDGERALSAVNDVFHLIEGHACIVEEYYAQTSWARRLGGVIPARVIFLAANDAEAADLTRKAQALPGIPAMDAVKWMRLKTDA